MSYEIFEKLKKEIFARGIFSVFLLILLLPLAKASVILNATDFIGFNISANEIARIVSGGLIVSGGWVNATNANFSQICLGGNCKTSWPANLVGGTGSANYIAKWQDPNTLTYSSVIYESGSNVGIGATNPGAKLHIQGGKLYVDPNNFGGTAAISLAVGDTDTGLNSAGDGQLDIYSNNVNTMSIRSGNVGIGTNSPSEKLHIYSGGIRVENYNPSPTSNIGYLLIGGASPNSTIFAFPRISGSNDNAFLYAYQTSVNDYDLRLYLQDDQDDSEKFSIWGGSCSNGGCAQDTTNAALQHYFTAAGNAYHRNNLYILGSAGIGTTSPSYKLHVQGGDIYGSNNLYIAGNVGIGTTSLSEKLELVSGGNIKLNIFPADDTTPGLVSIRFDSRDTGGTTHTWRIYTAPIGGGYGVAPNSIEFWEYPPGGGVLRRFVILKNTTASPSVVAIDGAGNVGVGTTSPSGQLDVSSSFYTATGKIFIRPQDGTNEGGEIQLNGAGSYNSWIIDNYQGRFRWHHDGTEYMTITSTGNVGIGTTTPDAGLHVDKPEKPAIVSSQGIFLSGGSSGNPNIELRGSGKLPYIDFVNDLTSDYDARLILADDNDFRFTGSGKWSFETGNVGIGTINPGAKLDVQGGNIRWGTSSLTTDQGGAIELGNSSGSGNAPYIDFHYGVGASQDYNVRIQNDANGRLKLEASTLYITGNLGIGTTTPSSKLEVYGGDIEINDGQANGTYKIKGLRVFYAGDETQVSTTSTTPELKKQFTAVFDDTYGIKPRYINIIAKIWNSGGYTTSLNVTLQGCGGTVLSTASTSPTLVKGWIDVSGCGNNYYPTGIYLSTSNAGGTAYNDLIEFYYVE